MSPGDPHCTGAWFWHEPLAGRRAIHRALRHPIAGVIAGHRDVARQVPTVTRLVQRDTTYPSTADTPRCRSCRCRRSRPDILRHPSCRPVDVARHLRSEAPAGRPGSPTARRPGPATYHCPVDGRYTATIGRPVAVVVAGHGDVTGDSPLHRGLVLHEPRAGRRTDTRRDRSFRRRCSQPGTGMSPGVPHATGPWLLHIPRAGRRPIHGAIGRAVAVVVAGHRDVTRDAPLHRGLVLHVPRTGRRPIHGAIGRPVAVVVAGHGDVAGNPPLHRGLVLHEPRAGRRPIHRAIRRSIAVEIASHRDVAGNPKLDRVAGSARNHSPVDGRNTARSRRCPRSKSRRRRTSDVERRRHGLPVHGRAESRSADNGSGRIKTGGLAVRRQRRPGRKRAEGPRKRHQDPVRQRPTPGRIRVGGIERQIRRLPGRASRRSPRGMRPSSTREGRRRSSPRDGVGAWPRIPRPLHPGRSRTHQLFVAVMVPALLKNPVPAVASFETIRDRLSRGRARPSGRTASAPPRPPAVAALLVNVLRDTESVELCPRTIDPAAIASAGAVGRLARPP